MQSSHRSSRRHACNSGSSNSHLLGQTRNPYQDRMANKIHDHSGHTFMNRSIQNHAKRGSESAGISAQSRSSGHRQLQVSHRSRWRLIWQSDHWTSTVEFATWVKPKMPEGIGEARRHSQEPNHTLGVENGGLRWSTHLLCITPLELAALRPQRQPKAREAS